MLVESDNGGWTATLVAPQGIDVRATTRAKLAIDVAARNLRWKMRLEKAQAAVAAALEESKR